MYTHNGVMSHKIRHGVHVNRLYWKQNVKSGCAEYTVLFFYRIIKHFVKHRTKLNNTNNQFQTQYSEPQIDSICLSIIGELV